MTEPHVSRTFVRELNDDVQALSESLLELERGNDPEAVARAFRAAHTIKGNCGMVGLDNAANLAHTIEDVLDVARGSKTMLSEAAVDDALSAVDDIDDIVAAAGSGRSHSVDVEARIETLQSHLSSGRASIDLSSGDGDSSDSGEGPPQAGATPSEKGTSSTGSDIGSDAAHLSEQGTVQENPFAGPSAESMPKFDDELAAVFESVSEFDDLDALVDAMDDDADEFADLEGGGSFDGFAPVESTDPVDVSDGSSPMSRERSGTEGQTATDDSHVSTRFWTAFTETRSSSKEDDDPDSVGTATERTCFGESDDTTTAEPLEGDLDDPSPPEGATEPKTRVSDGLDTTESCSTSYPDSSASPTTWDSDVPNGATADSDFLRGGSEVTGEVVVDSTPSFEVGPDDPTGVETPVDDRGLECQSDTATFESRFRKMFDDGDSDGGPTGRAVSTIARSTLDAAEFNSPPEAEPQSATGQGNLGSLHVDVERADDLLRHLRELELARGHLEAAVAGSGSTPVLKRLDAAITDLKSTVMDVRLMALSRATEGLARVARDAAHDTDTMVSLTTRGTDVTLDRDVIDAIGDPLVHLVRNAVDHGIEPTEERKAAGKPREGTVEVRARRDGDEVIIEVADDGAGLDADLIKERAVERGVVDGETAADLSVAETYELLFEPGFSTADSVTSTSGRGVGMDIVSRTVSNLSGSVEVETEPGAGTTVRLRVPVSVAVSDVLFVESGCETFAIPVDVVEGVHPFEDVECDDGCETVTVRTGHAEERLPLVRLGEAFGTGGAPNAERILLRITPDTRRIALGVDAVHEKREVVVTPYEDLLGGTPGVGGAALLSDDEVVNIIDVKTL